MPHRLCIHLTSYLGTRRSLEVDSLLKDFSRDVRPLTVANSTQASASGSRVKFMSVDFGPFPNIVMLKHRDRKSKLRVKYKLLMQVQLTYKSS